MEFLPDFGKYSFYVWSCYGLSVAVLLGFTLHTFMQKRGRK